MTVSLISKFTRRKIVDRNVTETQLHRVLSTLDLTLLGIGSTLGLGIYVLAGSVAKDTSGPAVVISFFVAAFASVLAGLCYAEFGARVPKAGSAYVYSYVCVGELIAFIVGWNLIMEYVIGVASVAKGYSGYVDSLAEEKMSNAFKEFVPLNVPHLSNYVDFFALGITLALTLILAFGVKESSLFNNIFTVLNLVVVLFVIIAGSIYAVPGNWALTREDIDKLLENATGTGHIMNSALSTNLTSNLTAVATGVGGFAPFGFSGIMKGAATCFYGFVGFDCIATTGEEAKNPQKAIPLAIIFSLLFIFLAYFGISTVLTMMVPYFLQDEKAPLPLAFTAVGFNTGKWFVTIGALFGLSTSLLGAMFPMPRVIYAMATDGVLFKFLSKVHPRFQTPLIATIIGGSFGGIMAALFDLKALMDMMSIGTLTAYTLVAVCVLCLRYRKDVDGADDVLEFSDNRQPLTITQFFRQFFNSNKLKVPTEMSSSFTNLIVFLYCVLTLAFCAVAIFWQDDILALSIVPIVILAILGLAFCLCLISLSCQPVSRVQLTFKVPLVPLIPGFSILANIYLIMNLSGPTWVRFGIWMLIGFVFYFYCLFTGTTDSSYEAQLSDKQRRKYSKISVAEIGSLSLTPISQNGKKKTPKAKHDKAESNGNRNYISNVQSLDDTIRKSMENGNHVLKTDVPVNELLQKGSSNESKTETSALMTGLKNTQETSTAAKDCVDSIMTLAHMHTVAQNCLNDKDSGDLKAILNSEDCKKEIQRENSRIQNSVVPSLEKKEITIQNKPDPEVTAKILSIHAQAQDVLKHLDTSSKGSKITLTTLVFESTPASQEDISNENIEESKLEVDDNIKAVHDNMGYDAENFSAKDKHQNRFDDNLFNEALMDEIETNRGNIHRDVDLLEVEPIEILLENALKEDLILLEDEIQTVPIILAVNSTAEPPPTLDRELDDIEKSVGEVDNAFSPVLDSDSEDISLTPENDGVESSTSEKEKSPTDEINKNSSVSGNVEELIAKSDNELKQIETLKSQTDQGKTL